MLAMWCWLQPFGQPDILMWTLRVSGSAMSISSTRCCTARLRPIELVIPSLQLSVPGQLTTSAIFIGPASPRSRALRRCQTSYTASSRTQRSTRFCSTVVRA